MPKKITTGTHSTQRTRRSYSTNDPKDQEPLQQALSAGINTGDPFRNKLHRIENFCKAILDAASVEYDPKSRMIRPEVSERDSSLGYALRALDTIHSLHRFIERSEARNAADIAFDLGALLSEWGMKPLADQGFKIDMGRAKGKDVVRKRNAERDSDIRRDFAAMVAQGLPRKAAIEDLMEKTGLKNRQLRAILPPARD